MPVDENPNFGSMLADAQSRKSATRVNGPNVTLSEHHTLEKDTELDLAIEYTLGDNNEDIIDMAPRNAGCELMRLLNRRYDPRNLDLFQTLQNMLFGFAAQKLPDFNATIHRLAVMERLKEDMKE